MDFLGTSRFRGASASALGARGDDTKGATDTKEELAKGGLATAAEAAADGVAEMRRMVGTGCEGVSEDGRGDGAREKDELGAGARDKRGNVLRIF